MQWTTLIKDLFNRSSAGVTGTFDAAVMWAGYLFCFIHIFLQSSGLLCFLLASRTKLTSAAEKESIAMFVRNLRQRLLAGPVRGSIIMGVDPGYKHGCKLAILSPTSKSPQTKANIIFCCALFIYLTKETITFFLSYLYRKLISGYCRYLPIEVWSVLCHFFSWHFYFFNLHDFQVRFCIQIFFTFMLQVNKEKQKSCVILWANTGTNAGGGYVRVHTRIFYLFIFFKVNCLLLIVSIIAVLRLSSEMGQHVGRLSPCSPTSSPEAIFIHWTCLTGRFEVIGQFWFGTLQPVWN